MRRGIASRAALVALAVLACGPGGAGASRVFENAAGRAIESTDPAFRLIAPEGLVITCALNLAQGAMQERNIDKRAREIAGRIPRAEARGCRNSTGMGMTNLIPLLEREVPWLMNYVGFAGVLPRITEIRVWWGFFFKLQILPGFECQYAGRPEVATSGVTGRESFTINRFIVLPEGAPVTLVSAEREELGRRCPRTLEVEGVFGGERVAVATLLRN